MRSAGIEVEVGRSTHRRAQDATIPPATVPSPFHIVNENVGQSRKQYIVIGKSFLYYRSFIASPGAKDDQRRWNTDAKSGLCSYT